MPRPKTGGRQAGTPNKRDAEVIKDLMAKGISPLEYMMSVVWDEEADDRRRDEMAKAAAPYWHPKVSTDYGMHFSMPMGKTNGSGQHNAEYTGIRVEFVRPQPRPDA